MVSHRLSCFFVVSKLSIFTLAIVFKTGCGTRNDTKSETSVRSAASSPSGPATVVDAQSTSDAGSDTSKQNVLEFNAFDIWFNGSSQSISEYPQWYAGPRVTNLQKDRLFVDDRSDYETNSQFTGKATEGAVVEANVLKYPNKDGRTLQLSFSPASDIGMQQYNVVSYCSGLNMRLPTARELLDYCAAGLTYKVWNYPANGRCAGKYLWLASVDSEPT